MENFKVENKKKLATNLNFIEVTNVPNNEKNWHPNSVCCGLTRSNAYDLSKIVIPVEWCENFNFYEKDVLEYIEIINYLKLNCKITLESYEDLNTKFNEQAGNLGNGNYITLRNHKTVLENKRSYVFKINGQSGKANAMEQYTNFILLRYIYNHQYYELGHRILKMYRAVPDGDVNFIIMAAHILKLSDGNYYNGYYSLTDPLNILSDCFLDPRTSIKAAISDKYATNLNTILTKGLPPNFPVSVIGYFKELVGKNMDADAYYLLKKYL